MKSTTGVASSKWPNLRLHFHWKHCLVFFCKFINKIHWTSYFYVFVNFQSTFSNRIWKIRLPVSNLNWKTNAISFFSVSYYKTTNEWKEFKEKTIWKMLTSLQGWHLDRGAHENTHTRVHMSFNQLKHTENVLKIVSTAPLTFFPSVCVHSHFETFSPAQACCLSMCACTCACLCEAMWSRTR